MADTEFLEVRCEEPGVVLEGTEHLDVADADHSRTGILGPVGLVGVVAGPSRRVAACEDHADAPSAQGAHDGVELVHVGVVEAVAVDVTRVGGARGRRLQLVPVGEDPRPLGVEVRGAHLLGVGLHGRELDAAVVLEPIVDNSLGRPVRRRRGHYRGKQDQRSSEDKDEYAADSAGCIAVSGH